MIGKPALPIYPKTMEYKLHAKVAIKNPRKAFFSVDCLSLKTIKLKIYNIKLAGSTKLLNIAKINRG